jgi:acyl-CoA reductase-like NAD-dependent aldehyde dehydrogenase
MDSILERMEFAKMDQIEGRLFIGGEFVAAASGETYDAIDPSTEEVTCQVSVAGPEDLENAVQAGQNAAAAWRAIDPSERGKILARVADAIEGNGEALAQIDSMETGRPLADSEEDIHAASGMFRYFAGLADKISGQTIPVQNDKLCYTRREPYGIIAAITAWNYPLFNASAKIAPILATGNACILKPAEEAPLTALKLASIIQSVEDLPQSAVSVLNGPGESIGRLLTHHNEIGKVTFTGSTETGRDILRASAESNLKSVTLELGGKSPFVIFPDADLEMALNGITFSVFFNQGQTCTAGTRLIVQQGIVDDVLAGLKDRISRIEVGGPESTEATIGPLISRAQFDKVTGYIERAKASGAHLVCGGGRPAGLDRGFFVEPTVFLDPPPESELVSDEIFGPVLVVQTFDSDDDALAMANATRYGLAASVWTRDSKRLLKFGHDLQAGIVWCNTVFAEHPGAPAGGYKLSGFGREYGQSAIEEYTRLKTVWVDLSGEYFSWV